MPNSLNLQEQANSVNRHRRILVADDELINRELLGQILQADYEVIFAKDGGETMEMIRANKDTLSLVLLDILMPVMTGLEILKEVREDPELYKIPIIVTTSETDAEIESLNLGAIDFIPKPYPAAGVIQARVLRTIELSEDKAIIQSTERDELTDLYNREFFYNYAEQYDQYHPEAEMDAVVVDVNRFHMLNERYGRAYGNEVLKEIGNYISDNLNDSDGLACRREADTFLVYCRHREDYDIILEQIGVALSDDDSTQERVHLRMGVYSNVDKNIDIEHRFDRAKTAADTIKGNLSNPIAYYDQTMHEQEMYAEQLIEAFPAAIEEGQFLVYYQPKFDIRPDVPILESAEALVRWNHPTLGMISPGVFIPLFEENGLIRRLDAYVWNETAKQIRDWKERFDYTIPVSVNVSRIDLYDAAISSSLIDIVRRNGIEEKDLLLEITESAYTQDSKQIIETVEQLRARGFQIEMDDFGTGYSSLNMISDLPIDALKLDMRFTQNAFKKGGNTHMLEVIIGISDFLSVPVIAEGVETEEQLHALKGLGCDMVQGYFFSKPVPANEFEPFILQKKEAELSMSEHEKSQSQLLESEKSIKSQLNVLRENKEETPEEEIDTEKYLVSEKIGFHLRTVSIISVILALIAAITLIITDISVTRGYLRMENASDSFIAAQQAASQLEQASDYLTDRVRCFVVTGNTQYMDEFFEEVEVTKSRDLAVENLEKLLGNSSNSALDSLSAALRLSNELVYFENRAMRLIAESEGIDMADLPVALLQVSLTQEELALSSEEKREKALELVFDGNYMDYKTRIKDNVKQCTETLLVTSREELESASSSMRRLVNIQTGLTILFLLIVIAIVLVITLQVRKPLSQMVRKMQDQELISPEGVHELRFVTRTYNEILIENKKARDRLSKEASHDALTGLFNRGAYDLLVESTDTDHMALILIDVDHFKEVNDTYGHEMGDRILKKVADVMKQSFRSVDILCRLGGDEFAVVMTRVNSSMKQLVINKIDRMNDILQHPKEDIPSVSLSVGVAFADRENAQGDIFNDADTALYRVKNAGRAGCEIF